jgi:hypothetical protein
MLLPSCLEIDYSDWRLYWVDFAKFTIGSVSFGGQDPREIEINITPGIMEITDFAIFEVSLFYIKKTAWLQALHCS